MSHSRCPVHAALALDQACFQGATDEQQLALSNFQGTWDEIKGTIKVGCSYHHCVPNSTLSDRACS